jgi:hypothetical protein
MAANPLIFKNAEKVRDSITESQKKDIAKLYEGWADEIGKMANYYSHKTTASAPLSERYYKELQKQLYTTSREVSNEVYKKIKSSMYTVSDAVVADNVNWLKQFGFSEDGLNAAFSYVPDSIVRSIVTGQVYESGWSLSSRIWGNNEDTMKDLYRIVAGGVAQQMPIKDIAKQLEGYVRPSAAKQWNLVDQDGKKIYPKQVDYNAQRLARTLVQHSYQQSFDAVCHNNPFVTDYIWRANGSRVCELCMDRDGRHYDKDALPLDHPNGMCTMEPNIDDNMDDKLVEWFNSEDGTFPEIDEFAKEFGYDASKFASSDSGTSSGLGAITREWIEKNCAPDKLFAVSGLTDDDRDNIINLLDNPNVSDDYKRAFAYAVSQQTNWGDAEDGSYFSPFFKTIFIDRNNLSEPTEQIGPLKMQSGYFAVFHEMGHGIDFTMNGYTSRDYYSSAEDFKNAMMNDIKALQQRLDNKEMTYRDLLNIRDDGNSQGVQDVLGACRFLDNGEYYKLARNYYFGHPDDYWKRVDVKTEMANELFAHISAAQVSTAEMKYIDEYFPEAKKEFEKIIEKVAKNASNI